MLPRRRSPGIESRPPNPNQGLEHLTRDWIAVLRWLQANGVEHVLVGAAAHAVRGQASAPGPVAIVPAPYGRNLERLTRALWSEHARLRVKPSGAGDAGTPDTLPVKLDAEKLMSGQRWTLRCGSHDLDIESDLPGSPRYQELLYEAGRFELEPGLSVEVASVEDLEHFAHTARTGTAPEIRITRAPAATPGPMGEKAEEQAG